MDLSPESARVLGSLIEKQLTTPQQYPLTLNALVLACNQTSNREPIVSYDTRTVEETLAALKAEGLVRFVHPSAGRSATRFRQVLDERLGLDARKLSLLGVLLLRGPQTTGELRARTERMARFEGIADVEVELDGLSSKADPTVVRLVRRPGQKEERWDQLLTSGGHDSALGEPDPSDREPTVAGPDGRPVSVVDLLEQITTLRDEVSELRSSLDELRAQLGVD